MPIHMADIGTDNYEREFSMGLMDSEIRMLTKIDGALKRITEGTYGIDWLGNFIVVITGIIPIFLILLGLFIVWLEADELKSAKEFKEPEKKK